MKNKKGIYYIENAIDERAVSNTAYFETLEEAKEAIKDCADWWCPNGTGRIYFREFGLNKHSVFICRGLGNGTFSDKRW